MGFPCLSCLLPFTYNVYDERRNGLNWHLLVELRRRRSHDHLRPIEMNDFLIRFCSLFRFDSLSLHCSELTEVVLQMLPKRYQEEVNNCKIPVGERPESQSFIGVKKR